MGPSLPASTMRLQRPEGLLDACWFRAIVGVREPGGNLTPEIHGNLCPLEKARGGFSDDNLKSRLASTPAGPDSGTSSGEPGSACIEWSERLR